MAKANTENNERRALCGVCPAGCRVIVSYDDGGRIDKVCPDEGSGSGNICKLGEHSAEIVYSGDRLLYPMRRKGVKGTYDFERISWDDAYEIIADRLNKIKAEYGCRPCSCSTRNGKRVY